MDFTVALFLYLILFVMLLAITWRFGIRIFSAVTVSALVSAIFLTILVPPTELEKYTDDMIDGRNHIYTNNVAVAVFVAIYLITFILIIWYVLCVAYQDRHNAADSQDECFESECPISTETTDGCYEQCLLSNRQFISLN